MSYIYLLSAIVCEVFATTFLKAANGFTVLLPSLAVALGYGGAFYFLSLSLSGIQLGTAYAIWSGLGIVLVKNWSGQRDLNPRHQPWQGCALPLSYTRIL